ncbi:MAG: carbonic anhydrase [Planctomycetes bacterium]|nr:carbonic anhydrase [Planctomycetota bacterium]
MRPIDFIYRFDPERQERKPLPENGAAARRLLEEGNRLFVRWIESCKLDSGPPEQHRYIVHYNAEDLGLPGASGEVVKQAPFAALLGCADARVPAEIIFGQPRNNLFVVRLAGNVLSDECLGSLDFAVNHLGDSIRIVVVLGHTMCGAVAAAVDTYLNPWSYLEETTTHALRSIVDRIFIPVRKAARSLRSSGGIEVDRSLAYRDALVETAVFVNTAQTAYDLRRSLDEIDRGDLQVVYGVYDLSTHRVRSLPQHRPGSDVAEICLADAPASLEEFEALTNLMAFNSLA